MRWWLDWSPSSNNAPRPCPDAPLLPRGPWGKARHDDIDWMMRRFKSEIRVFQYHSSVARSDAIGTSIRMLHHRLRRSGIASTIVCADAQFETSYDGLVPFAAIEHTAWRQSDVLIVHYSFLDVALNRIMALPVRKILVYHNVTPGRFFHTPSMSFLADLCEQSMSQIASFGGAFAATVGDSQFNCDDLGNLSHPGAEPIPVLFDMDAFAGQNYNRSDYFELKKTKALNLLFVGRFVPNKRHDLLIAVLSEAKTLGTRAVTLHLVGKVWDDAYLINVLQVAAAKGVLASVKIHVDCSLEHLKTLFAAADAFISMSEHEGFMVPLLEAFSAGCPVIAAATSAVGETMGKAGIQMADPDPALAAGFVHLLQMDQHLRREIIAGQSARAAVFHPDRTFARWIDLLGRLVLIREQHS